MNIDPDILRAFATEVDEASQATREADLSGVFSHAFDGTHGSAAQWMAQQVARIMQNRLDAFADGITEMGSAVRGTANNFQVEDESLAGRFTDIHATHPRANG